MTIRAAPICPTWPPDRPGLLYPGGISGYNTEGITVTLHQMYASDAVLKVPADQPRKAALAPIIQQTILREARTIEDAVKIANRYQAIATWTILIAEAKTGKAAAIEITKEGATLVRQTRDQPIAQTNHIFDTEQQAYAFFPNYNKYSETHVRMATLEKAFARFKSKPAAVIRSTPLRRSPNSPITTTSTAAFNPSARRR